MRNNTSISRQLKEKISALKGFNMSYREMSEEIGCCKSTIHYHLTPGAAEKIKKRSDVGFKKYGVTLKDDDQPLDVWLQHIQEELMDAVNYIEKVKDVLK